MQESGTDPAECSSFGKSLSVRFALMNTLGLAMLFAVQIITKSFPTLAC